MKKIESSTYIFLTFSLESHLKIEDLGLIVLSTRVWLTSTKSWVQASIWKRIKREGPGIVAHTFNLNT